MPFGKQGYEAIPTRDDEEEGTARGEGSGSGPSSSSPSSRWQRVKQSPLTRFLCAHVGVILCGFVVLALLAAFLAAVLLPDNVLPVRTDAPLKPGISAERMGAGLNTCAALANKRPIENHPSEDRTNPRGHGSQPVLLTNAVVWDGQGGVQENVSILLQEGIVKKIDATIEAPEGTKVIDVKAHVVSPGLVDMHSHLGVGNWPAFAGTEDTNEMTQPLTPFVRSLDAFNPSDKGIRIVASGGVTTVLVLPGSGNLMGGEAFAFKLRDVPTTSNEDMLVQAGTTDPKWRWMKMACGENPKRFYGGQERMPKTRLGEAYLFRQRLDDARALLRKQDDWCAAATTAHSSGARMETPFPEDLSLESLVALLRGDVRLNVHCYETHDIEAMVRHSLEFDFNITAFHHALDAYRIPDIIKRARNNITIATFADHWGYKKEAFQASPFGPKILHDAGIPVALKSDHPVLNAQHLAFEAAKSNHYGLPLQEAFKAVTSVPANALGLGHRVGSLKVGYDADVVIWDRAPLDLGATPLQVFVDGYPLFDEQPIFDAEPRDEAQVTVAQDITTASFKQAEGKRSFLIKNAAYVLAGNKSHDDVQQQVLVEDGRIVCVAEDCTAQKLSMAAGEALAELDAQGSYVVPGLIAVGSKLGMVEIPSEASTGDGVVQPSTSRDPKDVVFAVDGIKLGTRHLEEAYKGGVLTTISAPISKNVVAGVSAAFKTGADSLLSEGALLSPAVALHLQVGDRFKSDAFPTVSSQIAFIRQILTENVQADNYYGKAARGEIPTIIAVHNKDEIASLIHLKNTHLPKARFVVLGGAESHLVARHLAAADIPVVLSPSLCTPEAFDSIHCLTGAPLSNGTAAHVLHSHGVKVGLGVSDDGLARNLAWDAGWLAATSPAESLKSREAIRFVTTNLLDIYGLNSETSMAVWSGNPLDLGSQPLFYFSESLGIHEAKQ